MHCRYFAPFVLLLISLPVVAQEPRSLDRLLYESLREAHDKGAELFNAGQASDCYRMFQGALITAKGLLGHRPDVQKIITDGMAKIEREEAIKDRAFQSHELIEKVRAELRKPVGKEVLNVPPREVKKDDKTPPKTDEKPKIDEKPKVEVKPKPDPKPEPKPEPKPMVKVNEVKTGVVGRVLWQGKPLEGVDVTFVSLGLPMPAVYETTSGPQGVYTLPNLKAGKYIITLVPSANCAVKKLPERYATTTTTPLTVDAKGDGEKLDFVLQ